MKDFDSLAEACSVGATVTTAAEPYLIVPAGPGVQSLPVPDGAFGSVVAGADAPTYHPAIRVTAGGLVLADFSRLELLLAASTALPLLPAEARPLCVSWCLREDGAAAAFADACEEAGFAALAARVRANAC